MNIPETSSKTPCPDCGQTGAHYCFGKSFKPYQPLKYPDLPDQDNKPELGKYSFTPTSKRMSQKEIAEFGKWLKENEPVRLKDDSDYWELFAYRIVAKLGV